ncbi:hypothetical protein LCGC14_2777260 [marine sediment metagenome]|uniref:MT-A70 family protein n=1 Tax=marine sediment metagenome TaxID=412755 RepID=A0A0F8YUA8_9ZZZZ
MLFSRNTMAGAPYGVIYADPPWPSGKRHKGSHIGRTVAPPYPTMKKRELLEFPVGDLADDRTILVLWSTWMHLDLALQCIEAWGFDYCTGMPWLKVNESGKISNGLGIWFLNCSEPLLIAKRIAARNPRPARLGIIIAQRAKRGAGLHSRKPEEAANWIESKMPGPYIELFATKRRRGWTTWGAGHAIR